MSRARPGSGRQMRTIPVALVFAGCSAPSVLDAGYDAGVDAGTDAGTDAGNDGGCLPPASCTGPITPYVNACGQRCGCPVVELLFDGGMRREPYCDPDVGNPCDFGCANGREPDGGRAYDPNGNPECLC
jgi:hypothetical protein